MVAYYTLLGRQVGSHYLAMGCLSALFGGSYLALSGGSSKKATAMPPINASSNEESDFVKQFLNEAEKGNGATKH